MKIRAAVFLVCAVTLSASDHILASVKGSSEAIVPSDAAASLRRDAMVGKWHGTSETPGGGSREWVTTRKSDAKMSVEFRITNPDGSMDVSKEFGEWGVSGAIYFTITKGWVQNGRVVNANPRDASLYDAYEILALSTNSIRYRSVTANTTFEMNRVSDDFMLPPLSNSR